MVGFGVFSLCVGLGFFTKYNKHEKEKLELQNMVLQTREIQELAEQLEHYKRSAQNYHQRLKRISTNYDVDFDDDEIDTTAPQDQLIPQAVNAIAGKLPPSVQGILGNPKVIAGVADAIQSNPELVPKIIGLFTKSDTPTAAAPGPERYAV